jgi:hypothetical protein
MTPRSALHVVNSTTDDRVGSMLEGAFQRKYRLGLVARILGKA